MHTLPMEYLRKANAAEGGHFFDQATMDCFESRIESREAFVNTETHDAYFVTSERMSPGAPRLYKVRRFDDNCRVRTATPQPFADLVTAEDSARRLASAH